MDRDTARYQTDMEARWADWNRRADTMIQRLRDTHRGEDIEPLVDRLHARRAHLRLHLSEMRSAREEEAATVRREVEDAARDLKATLAEMEERLQEAPAPRGR